MLGRLSMSFWRPLFALALASLLVAAVVSAGKASGGGEEGGIGGTGIYFGQVTAFSSIIMNGERIALPDGIDVTSVEGTPTGGTLSRGDTLFVTASLGSSGPIATKIVRFFPIVGPVDWSASTAGQLSVLGTQVSVAGAVLVDPEGQVVSLDQMPRDAVMAVNGIWQSERIIATRVVALPVETPVSISGLVLGTDAAPTIGGTLIGAGNAEFGSFATVTGQVDGGGFVPVTVSSGIENYAPFDAPAQLSASAILSPDPDGQGFHLSGFGIPMDPASTVGTETGVLRVFKGTFDERFLITDAR